MHNTLSKLAVLAGALLLATTAHGLEETTWAKIKAEILSPQPSAKSANAAQHFFDGGIHPGVDADGNFGVICPPDDGGDPKPCELDLSISGSVENKIVVNKAKIIVKSKGEVTNLSGTAATFSNASTGLLFGVSNPEVLALLYPEGPLPVVVLTDKWHTTVSASGQTHGYASFSRNDLFPIFP